MKKLLCFTALTVLGLLVSCSTTFDGYDLTSNADIETVGAAITEATLKAQFDLFQIIHAIFGHQIQSMNKLKLLL